MNTDTSSNQIQQETPILPPQQPVTLSWLSTMRVPIIIGAFLILCSGIVFLAVTKSPQQSPTPSATVQPTDMPKAKQGGSISLQESDDPDIWAAQLNDINIPDITSALDADTSSIQSESQTL